MSDGTSLKNQFLLAMPAMTGSYFGDTVIYLCEHNADGAMGLVINKPGDLSLVELLGQLGMATEHVAAETPVMDGGPVARDRGFILHSDDQRFDASVDLGDGLMLTAAREVLETIGAGKGPQHYLVALGYAGWDGGQLENELKENAWLTCPATHEVVFDTPFEERVSKAAAILGIDFRLMSGQAGHA
ncbi:MAG: YqgE/AlgH family protein [Gammaproteobacteria bacterium]|jgi:putative transcriptional regulator|nr:YqgE/AlgH family protein [Gammaproteobacteria bacterium]